MLKIQQWIVFLVLFAVNAACFALPFDIYPTAGIALPTFVESGQSVSALYTVTNNANRTLNNNYVKYLPPNVAQVTTDATIANLCGPTFNLAPNGIVGDTCTLELVVSGSVNANDPDPHHHLFVCLFGGVLCAGTNFPLNVISSNLLTAVVVTPAAPTIAAGQSQQFTATAVFSDGTSLDVSSLATWTSSNTAVATISASGLATGVAVGTSTITATLAGISGSTILTVDHLAIVAGNYQTTAAGNPSFPILIQSSNAGSTWAYTVNSSTASIFPTGSNAFVVSSSSCSGALCLSVGSYQISGTLNIYGFQTQNAGTSYSLAISAVTGTLPGDYTSGSLSGVSCSGTVCAAAGSYNSTFPLVMQTTNSGASYVPGLDSTTPTLPTGFTNGEFTNATCTGAICQASGEYVTGGTQFPLLAQSVPPNGGAWAYALTSTNTAAIPDYNGNGIFNASACNASNCVAVGTYFSSTAGINEVPLAAQATGTGTGWTYEVTSANNPPDYSAIGVTSLNGAACATNACIAVGNYGTVVSGDNQDVPLIYQSIGGGAWTIVASNTVGIGPSLPTNFNAFLTSASCSGTLCVAAGTYIDAVSGNTLPLILVSTNSGGTWTIATNPTAPTGLAAVTIGATSCSGTFCTIAASYTNPSNDQPMVIQTVNSGTTFTYSVSAGSPAEPADALNVFFQATSISSLINQLTHKDFDHAKQLRNRLTHY